MAIEDASNTGATTWSPSMGRALWAGLVGGLIGFAIVQFFYPFIEANILPEMTLNPSDEEVAKFMAAHTDYYSQNYAIALAIVGACLGSVFVGLTVPTKKLPTAILAGIFAAAGAGIAGYFAGKVTGEELAWSKDQIMSTQALISFAIWGAMALGIALGGSALQGSLSALAKSIVVGLIAGILVVVANILVFAIVFPSANLSNHVPESFAERIVWILVTSLTLAATMAAGLKQTPSPADTSVSSGDDDLPKVDHLEQQPT